MKAFTTREDNPPAGANTLAVSISTMGSFFAFGANRLGNLPSGTFKHNQSISAFSVRGFPFWETARIAVATSVSPNPSFDSFAVNNSFIVSAASFASSEVSSKSWDELLCVPAETSKPLKLSLNKSSTKFRFSSLM